MIATAPHLRRWTRAEYHRLAECGFFTGERVELIDGEIVQMSPQKRRHYTAILLSQQALAQAFGSGCSVQVQGPLRLGDASEPEPDVAVVPGAPRDYADHPTAALLVVEVSDTTLPFDRTQKAALYARAGIAEYWILDLVHGNLIGQREPVADPAAAFGHRYAAVSTVGPAGQVSPLAAPAAAVRVADLLP